MTIEFDTDGTVDDGDADRVAGRRRAAAAVGAVMLVAAAGGAGFGIGRSVDRDTVAGPGAAAEADGVADEGGESAAPIATDAPADEPPENLAEAATDVAMAAGDGRIVSSGGPGYSTFGDQEMELLFDRTLADGVVVRAHLGPLWEYDQMYGGDPSGWVPPAWCYESGQARVAIAGDGVIDVGGVPWYAEPYQGRAVSWLTLGRVDDAPYRLVFVQAPPTATSVTVTFGDGATDSAVPVDGVALLAAPGEPPTIVHEEGDYTWYEETPDFVVSFDDGAEPVTIGGNQVGNWNDPEFVASCSPPPPALPDPGEQPADAAAAEAEIVAAMTALYGQSDDLVAEDLLDDATGVAEAREQVAEGGYESEASNAEAIVEELVFTSPTEAWFRYRVETGGIGLSERYGIAVLIDGTWKITRDTLCQDLSMAGGSCGDDVRTIRPPGYEYEEFMYEDGVVMIDEGIPVTTVLVD